MVSIGILYKAERNAWAPQTYVGGAERPSFSNNHLSRGAVGEGKEPGSQSQQPWETPSQGAHCSISEGAEQDRGMEDRSSDTDLGVGVGGARLGGG